MEVETSAISQEELSSTHIKGIPLTHLGEMAIDTDYKQHSKQNQINT